MIILDSKTYYDDFEWKVIPKNAIRTVSIDMISGNILSEDTPIHTERFESVKIGGNSFTLPLKNSVNANYYRVMYNNSTAIYGTKECAKARVDCVLASGSTTIELDDPITSDVRATINLSGHTYKITFADGFTYDDFPSTAELLNGSPYEWIQSKASQNVGLSWEYNLPKVSLNPWVKQVIDGRPLIYPVDSSKLPTVLTQWTSNTSTLAAVSPGWSEVSNMGYDDSKYVYVAPTVTVNDTASLVARALPIYDIVVPYAVSVSKISTKKYRISWQAPVRLSYLAASRTFNVFASATDLDNYAFVDFVDAVDVSLYADVIDKGTITSTRGDQTSAAGSEYIKNFNGAKEIFTYNTTFDLSKPGGLTPSPTRNNMWEFTFSQQILKGWKNGKHVVTCRVPAAWALSQGIQVGTQMQVKTPEDSFISRGNNIITFKVKNIEKVYKPESFTFILSLREES